MEAPRQMAYDQYLAALKQGQKYYKSSVNAGRYPYPPVLDDIFDERLAVSHAELGLIDIPIELIVGTKAHGRRSAFAGNFMPLLEPDSEFGSKWIALCAAHLSDEGIRDPIRCYEFMGRFYVLEGNKRVSVFKSYDSPSIPGYVTRIVPAYSEDTEVQVYYEFMRFYELSGLYNLTFTRPGSYRRLQAALGMEPDQVWTLEERRRFLSGFSKLKEALARLGETGAALSPAEALMAWLRIYHFSDIFEHTVPELAKELSAIRADLESLAHDQPIAVSTDPEEPDKNLVSRLLGLGRESRLSAAFLYSVEPEQSRWIMGHELGRQYLAERLGERVTTRAYVCEVARAEETMEQAVAEGANVIFAVTPPMIDACCRVAARHPQVKVLNCALSMPYPGVRTYYSRQYETKFLAGAIAGAMTRGDEIGYVADYPIYGVPASINAFALGARAVNPRARIRLRWTCTEDEPAEALEAEGLDLISRHEGITKPHRNKDWSLYRVEENGSHLPLASTVWHWGRFYVKVARGILNGAWNAASKEPYQAVNYWWGLSSGVIDLKLNDSLPDGVSRLTQVLSRNLAEGSLEPFRCRLRDQAGLLRSDGERGPSPEEIMSMDYLCEAVDGEIPSYEALRPQSRDLVRYLGIYRDQLPPEKEESQL